VPPTGFKYLVTEMVGWAIAGPQKYTGRSMRDSYPHLNITPKEWGRPSWKDFQETLGKPGSPATKHAEPKAIVQTPNALEGDPFDFFVASQSEAGNRVTRSYNPPIFKGGLRK
jgi:hypothetical protein